MSDDKRYQINYDDNRLVIVADGTTLIDTHGADLVKLSLHRGPQTGGNNALHIPGISSDNESKKSAVIVLEWD